MSMNRLSRADRVHILSLLVEGSSLRSISRITGKSINTVTKLLVDAGKACSEYQDQVMRNLQCQRIQLDEIWAFSYAKEKNVPADKKGEIGYGDIWTWVAVDPDTKLVPSWFVGSRDFEHAYAFVADLKDRLANRVQITSDGHRPYLNAVPETFKGKIDYAMLIKHYATPRVEPEAARRYSPTECTGISVDVISGKPDPKHISTSQVERQNLTMRMSMRRFTRLTNAFSKKAQNHAHAVSLHFMHYNFCRIHKSLRVTPAMAARVTDKLWEITDLVRMIEEWESH
jgi:IS1 family transposase